MLCGNGLNSIHGLRLPDPDLPEPVGSALQRSPSRCRGGVARRVRRHVDRDEPYRELTFDGGSATPIVGRLKKASWIYTGTVSKTLMPGLRVGYLIASPDLFPATAASRTQAADLHTNRVGQWQALQWIGTEHYREHLVQLRDFYRDRRDAFNAALGEHFSDLADWQCPQGGLFFG